MREMRGPGDAGAATVEFVLVGALLLTTLFVSLVELGLFLYVRNIATADASEGARYAANADVAAAAGPHGCPDAEEWTLQQLDATVPAAVRAVDCTLDDAGNTTMTVTLDLPGLGWTDIPPFTVVGHALDEG